MRTNVFLGCSRGFGAQVSRVFASRPGDETALLVGRKSTYLEQEVVHWNGRGRFQSVDFSKVPQCEAFLEEMFLECPQRLFYFAGGGPYGAFSEKQWKDHQWAFQVNLLTPANILHRCLVWSRQQNHPMQVIFVGSAIADRDPDPMGASYSSGKHGLRGLVESVLAEGRGTVDLRFYRPGYMDTEMLPPQARPRLENAPIQDPFLMATDFVQWANDPKGAAVYTP